MFSRCARCNTDLIKVGEGWKTAPRGYRVIWKDTPGGEPAAGDKAPETRQTARKRAAAPAAKRGRPRKSEAEKPVVTQAEAAGGGNGADTGETPAKRRRTPDRRVARDKTLPAKLGDKERRRSSNNRRQGFGKKPDLEA